MIYYQQFQREQPEWVDQRSDLIADCRNQNPITGWLCDRSRFVVSNFLVIKHEKA